METIKSTTVWDCSLIEFDRHHSDRRGDISVVENGSTLPFAVNRVYYLYDVPAGESRGGHAHKRDRRLVVAATGSFEVTLDDGKMKRTLHLNRPYMGVYVPEGIWLTLSDFSAGAVCMVLAAEKYSEEDYIRDYKTFITLKND